MLNRTKLSTLAIFALMGLLLFVTVLAMPEASSQLKTSSEASSNLGRASSKSGALKAGDSSTRRPLSFSDPHRILVYPESERFYPGKKTLSFEEKARAKAASTVKAQACPSALNNLKLSGPEPKKEEEETACSKEPDAACAFPLKGSTFFGLVLFGFYLGLILLCWFTDKQRNGSLKMVAKA